MTVWPKSLVLAGAGKMGGAMLEGWLKGGLPGAAVSILEPYPSEGVHALCAQHGARLNPAISTLANPEVLILAVKPQMLDSAASTLAAIAGPETLVVSIMAGKTIADMAARLPEGRAFVRAMPNTPAAVGRGISGLAASPAVSAAQKAVAGALLSAVGRVEWLDSEALIDAVTAVSGSGPAYVFHLVECLAAAGAEAGLPGEIALRLARATIEGAGELLFQDASTGADQLRKNVTSPGGTTAAALEVLMAPDGLQSLMSRAVAAAKRRAEQLSG